MGLVFHFGYIPMKNTSNNDINVVVCACYGAYFVTHVLKYLLNLKNLNFVKVLVLRETSTALS